MAGRIRRLHPQDRAVVLVVVDHAQVGQVLDLNLLTVPASILDDDDAK